MIKSAMLYRYPFFGGLNNEQIRIVYALMQEKSYQRGDIILNEGEPSDSLYFIYEGTVVVRKKNINLSTFGEGEIFGEVEILDPMPSAATVNAQTDTKLLLLSHSAIYELYKRDIKVFALIIMNLARDVCRRLRRMNEVVLQTTNTE
ncbi:MAG: cyclic nucleotide-binding domain-containing protein [Treponema sp.]|jgi:CRP-like cAMP-binding protein|nr:cyclic nucleotide-binding domain-containing protein [Treponema sp.]